MFLRKSVAFCFFYFQAKCRILKAHEKKYCTACPMTAKTCLRHCLHSFRYKIIFSPSNIKVIVYIHVHIVCTYRKVGIIRWTSSEPRKGEEWQWFPMFYTGGMRPSENADWESRGTGLNKIWIVKKHECTPKSSVIFI